MTSIQSDLHQAEDRIVKILASILYMELDEIDRDKTLFDLGLDSILAVEFVTEVRKEFVRDVKLDLLYQYPRIGLLAAYLIGESGEQD
jgi:acyl carrier protein